MRTAVRGESANGPLPRRGPGSIPPPSCPGPDEDPLPSTLLQSPGTENQARAPSPRPGHQSPPARRARSLSRLLHARQISVSVTASIYGAFLSKASDELHNTAPGRQRRDRCLHRQPPAERFNVRTLRIAENAT
ncbi:hypothetical protein AAFF_G00063960 [Aldrovandia affinis]|uniref:Uncharacterized protein n=1 Tax=Aldrovandia affinis TaxID=143900 RepID=A0AAD7T3T6_9TELE|nr:hypothetical protein AAFF_G00063960 [Aldrovandia affinis]